MEHVDTYFEEVAQIAQESDRAAIGRLARRLVDLRDRDGRLFVLGVGGSAGNCSHAVNDFRKLCGIQAYAPVDNVSELTARTNDEGWHTVFAEWMKVSRANENDAVLIFSVGGGNLERNISANIVEGIQLAKSLNMKVFGVVGRAAGFTAQQGDEVIVVPQVHPDRVTPHSEAFQAVVWQLVVSHPDVRVGSMKWESAVQ